MSAYTNYFHPSHKLQIMYWGRGVVAHCSTKRSKSNKCSHPCQQAKPPFLGPSQESSGNQPTVAGDQFRLEKRG